MILIQIQNKYKVKTFDFTWLHIALSNTKDLLQYLKLKTVALKTWGLLQLSTNNIKHSHQTDVIKETKATLRKKEKP